MMRNLARVLFALVALVFCTNASALDVVYDNRTPEGHREWAERAYIREQMEVIAVRICKALYGDSDRSKLHENFTMILHLSDGSGGAPAFAAGRRITWKVGKNPHGDALGGMGLLCHEMTHVLDMGSDRVFTEAMADWVRNYKVHYHRCTSPSDILGKRYKALRGGRHYGKYMAGANFVDFMTQNYGEGTIYKILRGYKEHGGAVWEKLFGKSIDGLVEEWRNMQTIYDPVFQWNYNGTAVGAVRNDRKFCALRSISAEKAADNSGAWLYGVTSGTLAGCDDGNITLALHGRFPRAGKVAIASLGSVKEGSGKALLLATTSKANMLAAHVVASVPGSGCRIVSTTAIPVEPASEQVPHSLILTVKKGESAAVILDGKAVARIDMKTKCEGCTFSPVFALGGIARGFGVAGFAEPRGEGGVLLDDVRVFTRTFRSKEAASYAATFGPDYRGGIAVEAVWRGAQGGSDIDDPKNWKCFNSYGEEIVAVPTKETEVKVWFKAIPSVPPKSKFACKSFTIDGLAVVDQANVDLRGVRIVELSDNTRLLTRNGYGIAVNAVRGKRLRVDGKVAVVAGMKLDGNLEMKGGCTLRLPENPAMAQAKSISLSGEGPVVLKPGKVSPSGGFQNVMRIEQMPEDMTRFKLDFSHGPNKAKFKTATGGKFIGVSH